jgi:hypothetical protein
MRLDRYSAITFSGLEPEDLAPALAAWVVPPPGPARWRRQRQGVPQIWQATALSTTDDLIGSDGCSIKVRWSRDRSEYLLRFVHRDEAPEIDWSTTFRLARRDGGTVLEAAVARDAPRGVMLEPKAGAPRVVIDLIQRHEAAVRPRELVLPALKCRTANDVVALLDQLLLLPERTVPVVIVARDVHGDGAVVDLDVIARQMQGIAVVASLDGVDSTYAFEKLLTDRGRSADLRCFNGAIHTYGPTADLDTDHRLWLRRSLETLPEDVRSDYVGETLARHQSLNRAPPSLLFAIEDFDRRERAAIKESARPPAQSASEAVGTGELDRLRTDLKAAEDLLLEVQDQAVRAEEGRRAAEQRRELAELETSTERMLRETLQAQIAERRTAAAAASLSPGMRDGLRAVAARSAPSPKQSLEVLAALFPERVVILQEALDSAETDGARFRKPEEVWNLLQRLSTGYYEALMKGGDALARRVFSNSEFAAQGSDGEMNSPACQRDRTRHYKGKAVVMWAHLRAGGHGAAEDCLRIHFFWLPEEKKILVGHCGASAAALA